jgi:O-antigen/teichoic acid export membrane protein
MSGAETTPAPRGLVPVIGGLLLANALPAVTGLVTAPLQARALGVDGRGALAAIVVPLSMAPVLLNLGAMQYAGKEAARGRSLGPLIGSLGAVYVAIGLLAVALAAPAARFFAEGRRTVETFLLIGFCLLPVALLGQLLLAVNSGLQRWRQVIAAQLIPAATTLVGVVALYALGKLTVSSATILVLAGSLASVVPLLAVLRSARLVVQGDVIREGVPFGIKAWIGTLAAYTNVRLDQLLMVRLVSTRQLGLYVVAVTIASVSGIIASAVAAATNPRVAQGDASLPPRALRVTLSAVLLVHLTLALLTPFILRVLFGSEFSDAAPMTWVLLAAGLPLAGVTVVANALVSANRPATTAYGEVVALAITLPGLAILLPSVGPLGAAFVSLAAYGANFIYVLMHARRRFGGPLRTFLLPGAGDVRWAVALAKSMTGGTKGSA